MSQAWMIIYTTSKEMESFNITTTDALTLALVESHEQDECQLASRKRWFYEPDADDEAELQRSRKEAAEAIDYAKDLAQKNKLFYVPNTQAHDHAGGDYRWHGRHKLLDE